MSSSLTARKKRPSAWLERPGAQRWTRPSRERFSSGYLQIYGGIGALSKGEEGRSYIPADSPAEEVWQRVKDWVKERTCCDDEEPPPSLEECVYEVDGIVRAVLGRDSSFPRRAIEFYAAEAFTMIERLRPLPPDSG